MSASTLRELGQSKPKSASRVDDGEDLSGPTPWPTHSALEPDVRHIHLQQTRRQIAPCEDGVGISCCKTKKILLLRVMPGTAKIFVSRHYA